MFSNIKNFYVLDVASFVKRMNLDTTKPSSIYLINEEITSLIRAQLKLKKYKGVVYINKNISDSLYYSFRHKFPVDEGVKINLIDNGMVPKYSDIMDVFDEVVFFERFKMNKIIDCNGFDKSSDDTIENAKMETND